MADQPSISAARLSSSGSSSSASSAPPPPPPPLPKISLVQPSAKRKHKGKVYRVFRSVFRSLPVITAPACRFTTIPIGIHDIGIRNASGTKVSGTMYGRRSGRVTLSIQENPRCLPSMVVELAMQTSALHREMREGMVRIALESERRPEKDKTTLADEPAWTMFCNGRKTGYAERREATAEDLRIMEILKAVTTGAGVIPASSEADGPDGELAYMRAEFEHVVGSKDSETLYLLSPDASTGPELTIFLVRI